MGLLDTPSGARRLVLFAHGSGSSRLSPRNTYVARYVARELLQAGLATLLFDLLTEDEERINAQTRELRFDIPLLTRRLIAATQWAQAQAELRRRKCPPGPRSYRAVAGRTWRDLLCLTCVPQPCSSSSVATERSLI